MEFISTDKAPAAIGPYSQGVSASNIIFSSGQLPINPENGELITDPYKATKMSLDNIKNILEAAGAKVENIVKVNIYLTNMDDFSVVNEAYAEFFKDHKPARSCVEVSKLPKDGVLEIEAIAVK
ncbi:RidA family protein [Peptoniphilus obesi]|uniref:RidA family protein n=1 Tax=Peptoniphilus obesi TaxID=1472765 RepID=UPI0004BBCA0B|nr:RidA family protein [Peptoniphilus obesi]